MAVVLSVPGKQEKPRDIIGNIRMYVLTRYTGYVCKW